MLQVYNSLRQRSLSFTKRTIVIIQDQNNLSMLPQTKTTTYAKDSFFYHQSKPKKKQQLTLFALSSGNGHIVIWSQLQMVLTISTELQ